jgi:transcriptional regulator with XRE-family HTH domain
MEIGKLIEKERRRNNISKAKLAEKVGCTSRAIDYWENGERGISLENADKIFKALGATIIIGNGSKLMNSSS